MPSSYRLAAIAFAFIILNTASFGQQSLSLDEIAKTQAAADQDLLNQTTDGATRAKILFDLGKAFQTLRQYDKSIESFKQVLSMNISTNDPAEARVAYFQAQWEIGNSYFGKGSYENALAAYETAGEKRNRNREGCGIRDFRNEIVQGITLERLGRFDEAIPLYLQADDTHLAELYFKAGQLEDLREIVNARNEPVIAEGMRKYAWTREKASESMPLPNLKTALDIYDQEKTEDWPKLMKAAYHYANSRDFGRSNIAISVLSRHMDKVLPLLKMEFRKQLEMSQVGVIYEILAVSRNNEAIAFLKDRTVKGGLYWENSVILTRTLTAEGDKGKMILDELESADKTHNLSISRQRLGGPDDRDRFGRFEVKFPSIDKLPRLPRNDELGK